MNLQMPLARICWAFFGCLFSTGDVNWYLGAEQLPGYFQLTGNVVVTHNDTCGNVKEWLWRDKKNLIILCISVTFLLGRVFLSSVSDTVSVQKKKIFIKMEVHQKVLSHKCQKYVYQQEHWSPPQNKVHSLINNSFAFAVTCCCWEISLQQQMDSGSFKMCILLCT